MIDEDAQGNTWVHPKIAIHLAMSLSPRFSVRVCDWVVEWSKQLGQSDHLWATMARDVAESSSTEDDAEEQVRSKLVKALRRKQGTPEASQTIQTEVVVPSGRIDVVTPTEVIEVESLEQWKQGLGQVLVHAEELYEIDAKPRRKRLHLFTEADGDADKGNDEDVRARIQHHCLLYDVQCDFTRLASKASV